MGKKKGQGQKVVRFRLMPRNPNEVHHPDEEDRVLVPDFRNSKKVDWDLYKELLKDDELRKLIVTGNSREPKSYDHLLDEDGNVVDDVEGGPDDFEGFDIEELEEDVEDYGEDGDMPPELDYDDEYDEEYDDEEGEEERRPSKEEQEEKKKEFLEQKKKELFSDDSELKVTEYDIHMFPDDGYDYRKHVSIGERGKFFPVPPNLENIPHEPSIDGNYDKEIMDMLMGDKEGEDDLDDDFLWQADVSDDEESSVPPLEEPATTSSSSSSASSFSSSAKQPLPKVERLSLRHAFENKFKRKFQDNHRRHLEMLMGFGFGRSPNYARAATESSGMSSQYREMMDEMFDEVMKKYDDEEIGELDDQDPRLKEGGLAIDRFESVFDEFLETTAASTTIQQYQLMLDDHMSSMKLAKAVSQRKTHLHSIEELDGLPPSFDPLEDEDDKLPLPVPKIQDEEIEEEEEEEEEEFEIQELVRKTEETWDCESILSTYSTIYNHPALIGEIPAEKKIRLKRGMPVLPREPEPEPEAEAEGDEEFEDVVNKGEKRPAEETLEEKKARKKAAKEEKKEKRKLKKNLKTKFKNEETRQSRLQATQKSSNPAGMRL
eukprot:TRINITY_DN2646_c1_g1_i1.p1 TRINITY_DN2646_c1_g1~~TRINITY_DN2646_c1_g1_i1.p1  ORF type:complete len:611 (+),score=355.95 TRINITY_DN2646_c1_g1_i1:29-1834(+)